MPENPEGSGTWKKLLFIVINLFIVFWLGLNGSPKPQTVSPKRFIAKTTCLLL